MTDTACPLLWNGIHITTNGKVYPCCISDHLQPFGDINDNTLEEITNSFQWKRARRQMMNGKQVKSCSYCYNLEKTDNPHSPRLDFQKRFPFFTNWYDQTDDIGTFNQTLEYVDVRFSNICNMKCRTCSPDFSSQWQEEYKRLNNDPKPLIISWKDKKDSAIEELLDHSSTIKEIYFAGGEPLITDEHYTLLEKLIDKGVSNNIDLRYSSNGSTIKYKKKDISNIWSKFHGVQYFVSADHYGERAEYIRHGIDWATVESNLQMIKKIEDVLVQMNSVVSVFNYATFNEFYEYTQSKELVRPHDMMITNVVSPNIFDTRILPVHLKERFKPAVQSIKHDNMSMSMISHCEAEDLWDVRKQEFLKELHFRDNARNESFEDVFPELREMLDG
jgi:radical SAM protein with 4Fe4S-binding SPASM domain